MMYQIRQFTIVIILTLTAVLSAIFSIGQKKEISQSRHSSYSQVDSISYYLSEGEGMINNQPLRAIVSINRAIELCLIQKNNDRIADAYFLLGNVQLQLGQPSMAIANYEKSERILDQAKKIRSSSSTLLYHRIYKQKAIAYRSLKNYEPSLQNIDNAIASFESNSVDSYSELQRLKSEILSDSNQHEKAIALLQQLVAKDKENGDFYSATKSLLTLGNAHRTSGNESKAIGSYNEAGEMAAKYQFSDLVVEINNASATLYKIQGNLNQEVQYRNKNADFNQTNNNMDAWSNDNLQIGNAYLNAQETDKAQTYLQKSLEIFDQSSEQQNKQTSIPPLQYRSAQLQTGADALRSLAHLSVEKKDYSQALKYYQRYEKLQDSIEDIRKQELNDAISLSNTIGKNEQRISLLEMERNLADKSIEILQQDQKLKDEQLFTRNLIIGIMAAFLLALIVTGILMVRNTREKNRADKLLALQSMTGQMNPHFIFNALNSVNEYITLNNEREANRYLSSFSKLMRQVMDDSRHTFIPLNEELEMLKLYLQLEHGRFKDRFDYELIIDHEVLIGDYVVPPMIIQPFIENAIWHGLRYRSSPGHLNIKFELKENELCVQILDDGIGIEASKKIKTNNQKKQNSLGMKNTETRIKLINDVFGMAIRLHINENNSKSENPGVRVLLIIPQPTDERLISSIKNYA